MATITETNSATEFPDPPPYTPPPYGFNLDSEDEEDSLPTTNFVIHASTTVHGSGNVISIPPPNTAHLAASIFAAMSQKSHLQNFSIQINCGINVIGDRNIVSTPTLRPLTAAQVAARQTAQADAAPVNATPVSTVGKRKTSEELEEAPEAKKPAVDTVAGSRPPSS